MLSKIREQREALRKLLPSIEKQRNELEWCQQMFDKHSSSDSEFIFIPIESDVEAVNIILHNFEEFGKTAHDRGFQLTAKYESDGQKVYVAGVQNEANLKEMKKSFDELVELNRQKSMESNVLPSFLTLPQTKYMTRLIEKNHENLIHQLQEMKINDDNIVMKNKILQEKVDENEMKSKKQQEELEEQTKKIKECEHQLKEMEKKNEEQIRKLLEPIPANSGLNRFLNQKNLEITKSSTVVMDGLGNRLSKREKGDSDKCKPPLKEIYSLERRRKEVLDYIEFTRINWLDFKCGTPIQKKIHDWFYNNSQQFLYNPSDEEKENSRKMFLNNIELENFIGTVHFLPIHYIDYTFYLCFAISNYRIVNWASDYSQLYAYSRLYNYLKNQRSWTENSKFATQMEVNNIHSDTFIHTSNKDVFVENEKVVTWIKNNFVWEQQSFMSSIEFDIIPRLYNFFINFYDPLSTHY